MATVIDNKDGSLTVNLTAQERDTVSLLPVGQLEAYITIWLKDRSGPVLSERFEKLDPQDKIDVLATLKKSDVIVKDAIVDVP
jgi:hypothetical protein